MKKITFLFLLTGFWAFAQDFVDVTGSLPQLSLGFSAWGDYDGDGDLDLYYTGFLNANSNGGGLYQNDNGTFTLVTNSGLPMLYMGAAQWGDMDNDGDMDIVIMGFENNTAQAKIYINNGNDTFTDANAGLPNVYMGDLNLGDVNGDGLLDIALTGLNSTNNVYLAKIYINNGNNNFTELTSVSLPPMNYGKFKFADYDADGDMDFVLNGRNEAANAPYTKIWQNDGNNNFTEMNFNLPQLWLGDVEWGDMDNDGDLDLVICGTPYQDSETHLLLNNGGTFTDDPHFSNVTPVHRVASIELADFDNDGALDIFIAGTNVVGSAEVKIAKLYNNNGSGVFTENTNNTFTGVDYTDADAADYDNDGKIDLFYTGTIGTGQNTFPYSKLYHNGPANSVNEELAQKFSVYPNPAHDVLNIDNQEQFDYKVQITDLTGKSILKQTAEGNVRIDVSNLPTGMYLVKISNHKDSFVQKLIIK